MEQKLRRIISDVLIIDESEINEDSSQNSLSEWDSVNHLNIITSIEEEFNIVFEEEDIIEMLNFKLVVAITEEVIARNGG